MLAHPTPAIEAPGVTLLLASFFEAFRVRPPVFFEERRRSPHVDVESFLRLVSPVEPVEVGVAVGRVDSGELDLPLGRVPFQNHSQMNRITQDNLMGQGKRLLDLFDMRMDVSQLQPPGNR